MAAIANNNQGLAGSGNGISCVGYCSSGGVQGAAQRAFDDGNRILSLTIGFNPITTAFAEDVTENGMVIVQSSNNNNRFSSRNVPGVIHTGRAWSPGRHRPYGANPEGDIDVLIVTENMPRLEAFNNLGESGEGTSIGAPFLAGIVGLMRSANPCLPPPVIEQILKDTAYPKHNSDLNNLEIASGVVNAYEAVKAAQDFEGVDEVWSNSDFSVIDNRYVTGDLVVESGLFFIHGNLYMMAGKRITVESGATLIVNGSIRFGDDSEMIIKRGGKVDMNGGTLTKSWCATQWRGVRVEGNVNLPHPVSIISTAPEEAGVLYMWNNSVIEYAKNAVRMRSTGYSWPEAEEYYGGLVIAENSAFRHNERAVEFMRYGNQFIPDRSSFTNVTFDDHSYAAITNWNSDGVRFDHCTFSNYERNAILTYNAQAIIENGCVFEGGEWDLDKPDKFRTRNIEIVSTAPGFQSTKIGNPNPGMERNYFSGGFCSVWGTSNGNTEPLEIKNNEFAGEHFGIYLNGITFHQIEENTFLNSYEATTLASNGSPFNVQKDNSFDNCNKGIIPAGDNRNYRFIDNCFNAMQVRSVSVSNVGNLTTEARIFPVQGYLSTELTEHSAAGNTFNNGTLTDIQVPACVMPFEYYIPAGTISSSEYWPSYTDLSSLGCSDYEEMTRVENGPVPSSVNCGAPGRPIGIFECIIPSTTSGIESLISELEGLIAGLGTIDNKEEQLMYYDYLSCIERAKDGIVKKYAEVKNYAQAQTRFQSDDFLRKTKVYGMMVKDKETTLARNYLNALPTATEEETDFKTVQNINLDLIEGDFVPFDNFSDDEGEEREQDPRIGVLREIGLKFHQPLSGYARSLYFVLTGERILIELNSDIGYEEVETLNEHSGSFYLYPNPTGGNEVMLTVPENIKSGFFQIFDMTGKMSVELPIIGETVRVNTSEWTSGLYLLQVYNDEDVLWQTKFVKL